MSGIFSPHAVRGDGGVALPLVDDDDVADDVAVDVGAVAVVDASDVVDKGTVIVVAAAGRRGKVLTGANASADDAARKNTDNTKRFMIMVVFVVGRNVYSTKSCCFCQQLSTARCWIFPCSICFSFWSSQSEFDCDDDDEESLKERKERKREDRVWKRDRINFNNVEVQLSTIQKEANRNDI